MMAYRAPNSWTYLFPGTHTHYLSMKKVSIRCIRSKHRPAEFQIVAVAWLAGDLITISRRIQQTTVTLL